MTQEKIFGNLTHEIFEGIFNEYYAPLCRFAAGYLSDTDSSEEIVQQVLINLWDRRDKLDSDKSIKSYLFTSVKNRCLNHIRNHKKFRNRYLDLDSEWDIPVDEKYISIEKDVERLVKEALDKLPEKCREIFILCRFEEMKYKEVADHLQISPKTVEAQMSKALKILREELKDVWMIILLFQIFNN